MVEIATITEIAQSSSKLDGRGSKHAERGVSPGLMPMVFGRELGEADLPAIAEAATTGAVEPYGGSMGLKQIRASHHLLAMNVAAGASNAEASFVTGYSPNTISALRRSPMFIELVAYYQSQKEAEFKDFFRQAAAIGMDALQVMHERILTAPEKIKFDDLRKLAEGLMDRTVLPSKAAKAEGQGTPQPAPITVIQFIDSPHAGAPAPQDPRTIEGTFTQAPRTA